MLPEIFYHIAVMAFISIMLGVLPCYAIYAGYKAIKMTKDLTNTNEE